MESELVRETRRIKNLIRKGILPSRMFVKGPKRGQWNEGLERRQGPKGNKLTWRTESTLKKLTEGLK